LLVFVCEDAVDGVYEWFVCAVFFEGF